MISVTKLIEILNKPNLLYWANKLGLNGIDLNNYYKDVKKDGISKHNEIELFLKNGTLFDGSDTLKNNLVNYEVVAIEKEFTNDFII